MAMSMQLLQSIFLINNSSQILNYLQFPFLSIYWTDEPPIKQYWNRECLKFVNLITTDFIIYFNSKSKLSR